MIVNPTHFAVALKYDPKKMRAPRVLAKGVDLVAQNIRRIAEEHRVPVFESPKLARALYRSTDLNKEIPAGLYVAVAQVLSYIFRHPHLESDARGAHGAPESAGRRRVRRRMNARSALSHSRRIRPQRPGRAAAGDGRPRHDGAAAAGVPAGRVLHLQYFACRSSFCWP